MPRYYDDRREHHRRAISPEPRGKGRSSEEGTLISRGETGRHRARDPFTRHGLWEDEELVEGIIFQCTLAEASDVPGAVEGLVVDLATTCQTALGSDRCRITPEEVLEGWEYMKAPEAQHDPRNPYRAWRHACKVFASGMHCDPSDFQPSSGEKSLRDFKRTCELMMLESVNIAGGRDHAEAVRHCIQISVQELSEGRAGHHRPHSGACKLTYPKDSTSPDHNYSSDPGSKHRTSGHSRRSHNNTSSGGGHTRGRQHSNALSGSHHDHRSAGLSGESSIVEGSRNRSNRSTFTEGTLVGPQSSHDGDGTLFDLASDDSDFDGLYGGVD